jgi:cyclopropane-fatty-acyl-phospholipid synthase
VTVVLKDSFGPPALSDRFARFPVGVPGRRTVAVRGKVERIAFARTDALRGEIVRSLPSRPFTIEFWDGAIVPATGDDGPVFRVRSPKAVAHAVAAPGQLGLGRAYATGLLEVDNLDKVMDVLSNWDAPPLDRAARTRLTFAALRATGLTLPPRPPKAELRPKGRKHSKVRDARAVRHHYDVSNEYFGLFLDESMTYSCAIFSRGARTLEEAQQTKLDLICAKLALERGQRMLDVGCGWGSLAIHAAEKYGVDVVGITLSEHQATLARERAAEAGVADKVDIQVRDYRDLAGERFDAVASIGMVEHVGDEQIDVYAKHLAAVLSPGGRLLNHGIARLRHSDPPAGPFSERYVFPDGEPLHLSRIVLALERAGLEPEHVEGFAADYAETLRHWARRFDERFDDAVRLGGAERARVWRLYLRAARNGFEVGFTSVFQVLCRAP